MSIFWTWTMLAGVDAAGATLVLLGWVMPLWIVMVVAALIGVLVAAEYRGLPPPLGNDE